MLLNKTRTVFSRAAQDGDIGALVALLPQVLDLGESDITLLALLNAAELGRSDVVMFLLDVGCVTAVDEVNREEMCPNEGSTKRDLSYEQRRVAKRN